MYTINLDPLHLVPEKGGSDAGSLWNGVPMWAQQWCDNPFGTTLLINRLTWWWMIWVALLIGVLTLSHVQCQSMLTDLICELTEWTSIRLFLWDATQRHWYCINEREQQVDASTAPNFFCCSTRDLPMTYPWPPKNILYILRKPDPWPPVTHPWPYTTTRLRLWTVTRLTLWCFGRVTGGHGWSRGSGYVF